MAEVDLTLSPNETSDPIEVPARQPFGIEASKPCQVYSESGTLLWDNRENLASRIIIPPTDSITIIAGQGGCVIKYSTED